VEHRPTGFHDPLAIGFRAVYPQGDAASEKIA
jgi:hypothetical protein